jgi:hypothetical protein
MIVAVAPSAAQRLLGEPLDCLAFQLQKGNATGAYVGASTEEEADLGEMMCRICRPIGHQPTEKSKGVRRFLGRSHVEGSRLSADYKA